MEISVAFPKVQKRRMGTKRHLLLAGFLMTSAVHSQTVTVRLLNGSNGKPLKSVMVYVGFNDLRSSLPLRLKTDRQGEIRFGAKTDSKTLQIHPIGIIPCAEKEHEPVYKDYTVLSVLLTGAQTEDTCGSLRISNTPGRMIFFGKPATAWQMLTK